MILLVLGNPHMMMLYWVYFLLGDDGRFIVRGGGNVQHSFTGLNKPFN